MRITIAHKAGTEGAKEAIDRGINEGLKSIHTLPVQIAEFQRSWNGSVLTFFFTAKRGFLNGPVTGTVTVADTWIEISVDPGIFGHFIPEDRAQEMIKSKVREVLA